MPSSSLAPGLMKKKDKMNNEQQNNPPEEQVTMNAVIKHQNTKLKDIL